MSSVSDEMLSKFNAFAKELGLDLGQQGVELGVEVPPEAGLSVSVSQELRDLAIELGRICGANGLYRFGHTYVTIHEEEKDEHELMCVMEEDRFVSWVQNFVQLTKYNAKEGVEVALASMTGVMARQVMAAHEFRNTIPKIRAVLTVPMPVMRDGVPVMLDTGYNVEEEIYVVRDVPEVVDRGIKWALDEYEDIFGQLPVDSLRSKAAHMACGVGLYSRYLFPDKCAVPLFQYTANMEGAGKSLAAKGVIIPVYGSSGSSAYGDGDKFKEMLNSVASSRKGYVFFDDMTGSLFNQDLNRWVTDSTWEYRRYHTQSLVRVDKNCMSIITDNGCTLSDDLIRRSVIISYKVDERASDRQKKLKRHIDEQWLMEKENRGRILSIWWSMICHWVNDGMPDAPQIIPSFKSWTNIVGGVVGSSMKDAAGKPVNAFAAADLTEGGDKRRTEIDRLLAEAINEYADDAVGGRIELKLGELCAVARENSLFTYELSELHLVRQMMDSAPGKYYDMPGDGVQLDDQMRHIQSLSHMHPQKEASPFSKRLKKHLGMKFNIDGATWVMSFPGGRRSKYLIECIEPF